MNSLYCQIPVVLFGVMYWITNNLTVLGIGIGMSVMLNIINYYYETKHTDTITERSSE